MGMLVGYILLVVLRLVLTFLPETGYIHPDEFFQSAEVVAGNIFHGNVYVSWEFNQSAPIRNIAIPYFTCGLPFVLLKIFSWILTTLNGSSLITTYWLLVVPRMWMTLLSFIMDFFMWRTCCMLSKNPFPRLCVLASSYVTLTHNIRASSNAVESLLFAALLYYIVKAIIEESEIQYTNTAKQTQNHCQSLYKVPIATLLSLGFFNRPTFAIFALAPVAFWLQFNPLEKKISLKSIAKKFTTLMPVFYAVSLCLILTDTVYYNFTLNHIVNLNFINSDFKVICTPCNFILYNTNSTNLESHGSHPIWLHLLVNVPLLFGFLGVLGFFSYWSLFWFKMLKLKNRWLAIRPMEGLMASSYTLPVLLLSLFSHQEPRFLIPVLFPLVLACGSDVWGGKWYSLSRVGWLLFNGTLLFFYGFLHQGGIVPSSTHLTTVVSPLVNNGHTIYFHTYMPPRYLTTIPMFDRIVIHDLGGSTRKNLEDKINSIFASKKDNDAVLLLCPTTMRSSLTNSLHWKLNLIYRAPLHLSTEDLPVVDFMKLSSDVLTTFTELQTQFGLDLYNITQVPAYDSQQNLGSVQQLN